MLSLRKMFVQIDTTQIQRNQHMIDIPLILPNLFPI